jgi:hypothetical protein
MDAELIQNAKSRLLRRSMTIIGDTIIPSLEAELKSPEEETVIIKIWYHNKEPQRSREATGIATQLERLLTHLRDVNIRETDKHFSNVYAIHPPKIGAAAPPRGDIPMLISSLYDLLQPVEVINAHGGKNMQSRFTGITDIYIEDSFRSCDLIFAIGVLNNTHAPSDFTLLAMNFVSICKKSGTFHLDGLCTNNIVKKDRQIVKFPKIGTRLMQFITDFAKYAEYSRVFTETEHAATIDDFLCRGKGMKYLATFEAVPNLIAYYLKFGYIMEERNQDNYIIVATLENDPDIDYTAASILIIENPYTPQMIVHLEDAYIDISTTAQMVEFNTKLTEIMIENGFLIKDRREEKLYNQKTGRYDKEYTPFMFLPRNESLAPDAQKKRFNSGELLEQMSSALVPEIARPRGRGILKKKKKTYNKYKNKRRGKTKKNR